MNSKHGRQPHRLSLCRVFSRKTCSNTPRRKPRRFITGFITGGLLLVGCRYDSLIAVHYHAQSRTEQKAEPVTRFADSAAATRPAPAPSDTQTPYDMLDEVFDLWTVPH